MEDCPICQTSIVDCGKPTVRLGEKGCTEIINANSRSKRPVEVKPGDIVHTQCRKDFTRPRDNSKALTPIICSPQEFLDLTLNNLILNLNAYFVLHLLNVLYF